MPMPVWWLQMQTSPTTTGILNGWVLSPKGKALLLNAVDANKRPLFINSMAEGAVPMILGSKTLQSKGRLRLRHPQCGWLCR